MKAICWWHIRLYISKRTYSYLDFVFLKCEALCFKWQSFSISSNNGLDRACSLPSHYTKRWCYMNHITRYFGVNFIHSFHKSWDIAHPWGREIACLLWVFVWPVLSMLLFRYIWHPCFELFHSLPILYGKKWTILQLHHLISSHDIDSICICIIRSVLVSAIECQPFHYTFD